MILIFDMPIYMPCLTIPQLYDSRTTVVMVGHVGIVTTEYVKVGKDMQSQPIKKWCYWYHHHFISLISFILFIQQIYNQMDSYSL